MQCVAPISNKKKRTTKEKEKHNNKREKVVMRMEAGKPEKRSRPYRGLICWTEKGSQVLNAQIARTVDAVMDEQDAQWDANVENPEVIAALSQQVTAVSAQKALHIAYEDEQEAIAMDAIEASIFRFSCDSYRVFAVVHDSH